MEEWNQEHLRILQLIEALHAQGPDGGNFNFRLEDYGLWDPAAACRHLAQLKEAGVIDHTFAFSDIHGGVVRIRKIHRDELLAEIERVSSLPGNAEQQVSSNAPVAQSSRQRTTQFFKWPAKKVLVVAGAIVTLGGAATYVQHVYSDLFSHHAAHRVVKPHSTPTTTASSKNTVAPPKR
jgi:hypothetical protein